MKKRSAVAHFRKTCVITPTLGNVIKLMSFYKITFDPPGRWIIASRLSYKRSIHSGSEDACKQWDKRSRMDRMFIGTILTSAINDPERVEC